MSEKEFEEQDIKDWDEDEHEEHDGIADAAAAGWGDKPERDQTNQKPGDGLPCIVSEVDERLHDLLFRGRETTGNVEFSKIGQEKVELKNGFNYTQNQDGSIAIRGTDGTQYVVANDNTLTVIRANGQVETYKPQKSFYKDGGSVGYNYPEEAGFNMVRKARGFGNTRDTGVEITAGNASFSTVMMPGRQATFSYAQTGKVLDNLIKHREK